MRGHFTRWTVQCHASSDSQVGVFWKGDEAGDEDAERTVPRFPEIS